MDPLSVTSGMVGIVAFTFQMAKMASTLRDAVEHFKSGPKEASDLVERLTMLGTACERIRFHVERRASLPEFSSPASLDIISKALAQYRTKMEALATMMSSLGFSSPEARNQNLTSNTTSRLRLRLLLRKDKIKLMVQEMDQVVSLLQLFVTLDMWTMPAPPVHPPPLASKSNQLVNVSPDPEAKFTGLNGDNALSQSQVAVSFRKATYDHRRTSKYFGCVTWTTIEGRTGGAGDDNRTDPVPHMRGLITFRLPFSSTQLDLEYTAAMGSPSYALNVTHIIDFTSQLGQRVSDALHSPMELHKLLSERELSLYSLFKNGSEEMSLFWLAVGMRWTEGCRYLLQHDFRHKFLEDDTPSGPFMHLGDSYFDRNCEITDLLLSARSYDTRIKDMKFLVGSSSSLDYLIQYLKVFLECPMVNRRHFLSFAWCRLVDHAVQLDLMQLKNRSRLIPAILYFIEQGVDVHQTFRFNGSAYIRIISSAIHAFDADDKACSWVAIMKACGIDIKIFIERETNLVEEKGLHNYYVDSRDKRVVYIEFEGLAIPSWRWDLTMEDGIIEVLEEFNNFGGDTMGWCPLIRPSGPDDFKSWKTHSQGERWTRECFPFLFDPIDSYRGGQNLVFRERWCRETYIGAVRIRDDRSARRQARNWKRTHPGEKLPSNRMPGTWVD